MRQLAPLYLAFLTISVCVSAPAYAQQTPPKPVSKKAVLEQTQTELEATRDKAREMAREEKSYEQEYTRLQKDMIALSRQARAADQELSRLESEIARIRDRRDRLKSRLKKDRIHQSALLMQMQRLSRRPPESLTLRPEGVVTAARTAMIIDNVVPDLQAEARELSSKIRQLQSLEEKLTSARTDARDKRRNLKGQQLRLATLTAQRQQHLRNTRSSLQEERKRADTLARKANSLQSLIDEIEKDRARLRAVPRPRDEAPARGNDQKSAQNGIASQASESFMLPVSGVVAQSFGDENIYGTRSQGIRIRGRQGMSAVAPRAGTVRFAGPFKSYGQLVILAHAAGYHSLIGGLSEISVIPGQDLAEGEPIGILVRSNGTGQSQPLLYFEIRRNGKPVDPIPRIAGLNDKI